MAVSPVRIMPPNRKNGPWLLSMGITLLFMCLWLAGLWWHQARYLIILVALVALIMALLGGLKLLEPRFSLLLGVQGLQFVHRNGCWHSDWDNILAAGQPVVNHNGSAEFLPYVGLSLKSLDRMADAISPRLANKLLREQQELLTYGDIALASTHAELLNDCQPFRTAAGDIIRGPVGGWLHRCQRLREPLGYHLFIPNAMLDRSPRSFVHLVQQCRQQQAADEQPGP